MPDNIAVAPAPGQDKYNRPFWWPETQGFLATAIVGIMLLVIMVLLLKDYKDLNEKVYGALLTLLGVIAACFKDVFSFYFGSSRGSDKKDDMLGAIASAPQPPTAPVTPDQVAEATLTNGQRTYYGTLTDPEAKKVFLGMSNAERDAEIGKH